MTIELHTWNTPNGRKISVALEEMELPYRVIPVNITKGEQMAPSFLAISPNNRIPALIVADDGRGLWKLIAADKKPFPAGTFEIHDEGFVRNDANRDIEND